MRLIGVSVDADSYTNAGAITWSCWQIIRLAQKGSRGGDSENALRKAESGTKTLCIIKKGGI